MKDHVKEPMEYKLERLNTTLIRFDLQYTALQQVDVLLLEPNLQQIYERLARKSRDVLST